MVLAVFMLISMADKQGNDQPNRLNGELMVKSTRVLAAISGMVHSNLLYVPLFTYRTYY